MKNPTPKIETQMTWAGQTLQEYEAEAAVRDALDHADRHHDNLIKVGRMPKSIRDLSGIDGDLFVFRNHLYENIKSEKEAKKENRYSKDAHYHAIGEQAAVDAIMALENPALVIDDSEGKNNPQIVMVLPVVGKMGTPLVAAIGFYENEPINGKLSRRPHITLSIYEKLEGVKNKNGETYKSLAEFVDNAVENGKVLGYNKEISDDLPVIAQCSGLGNITESSLNNNLSQFRKNVNHFKAQNRINYQKLGIGETAEEQEARAESVSNLNAENDVLRARAKYWKDQTRQTKERTVRQQDTDRLANDLLRKFESRTDKGEVKAAIKELGDWLVQSDGDTLSYDELRERARAIAEDIVDGNYALIDDSQSEILRNPHAVVKQLTMFMTQRLQNTNLLFSSAAEYMKYSHDLKAGINGVTVEDVSVARTRFLWAGTSQLIASGMIVLFKAAADAIMHSMNAYRDDDDELTKESVVHR